MEQQVNTTSLTITLLFNVGYQIDSIVRQYIWAGGFDYPGISTGHGVTHGLGVIEGGTSISSARTSDQYDIREGMILTIGSSSR